MQSFLYCLKFYVPLSSYGHVETLPYHTIFPDHFYEEKITGCFALIVLCLFTVNFLWLFFKEPWVGLHCVIKVYLDHTGIS